ADALLQDRRGVHELAQRPSGPFRHGRRRAKRALHPASGRVVPPRGCGGAPARSRTRLRAHEAAARRARDQLKFMSQSPDPDLLSLNTATVREKWSLRQMIEGCARHGIRGIAPWRDKLAEVGVKEAAKLIRTHGLTVTGLCRGGMFPAADRQGRPRAIEDNLRAIEDAATLEARCLVLVVGGLPAGSKDLAGAREQVRDGIGAVLDHARNCGVPLAIEPLHPMYAADRACVNTMAQANDLCD